MVLCAFGQCCTLLSELFRETLKSPMALPIWADFTNQLLLEGERWVQYSGLRSQGCFNPYGICPTSWSIVTFND